VPPFQLDFAGVTGEEPADDRDRGGLAGAIGAEQPIGLAGRDREPDAIDLEAIAETISEARCTRGSESSRGR
jgi:hypothetical protein